MFNIGWIGRSPYERSVSPPSDTTKDTAQVGSRYQGVLVGLVHQVESKSLVDAGLLRRSRLTEDARHPAELVQ